VTATTIQTNGTHQTANNPITFNGIVTLQAGTTASAGNAAIDFNGTVDGGWGLTVNTTGVTTFVGNVGGTTLLASVTTNAGGSVNLPALVRTTGNQTYNDAVILVANTVLVGATPTFATTVTGGGFDLTLSFTGPTTIDGAVITGVKNLTSDNGSTTTLTGNITTTGPQSYVDAVVVSGPGATLVSGGTNISFSSTVNGTAAGTQSLTMNAGAANATFGGIVGVPTSLASLSVTAAGIITIRNVTTTGAQSFTGPVSLGAAATLTTAGGNIAFSSTVDGATFNLALVSHGGTTTATGNLTNVGTLTLQDNTAPSTGAMIFNGSVQAASLATWARGYEIRFNAGGTVTNTHIFLNTGDLRIANGFGFTFTGGATKNVGTKFLSGTIQSTNAGIDFNTTPVTLTGNTTISTGAGIISLGAVTGGFTLALSTSVNATIESANLGAATLDLAAVLGGTVTVTGGLTVQVLTTAATGANIALNGGGTIQNAVTFNNTGSLTITNGFIFANGVLPPGGAYPSLTSLAGSVSATAGTLDFGNTAVTANCTLSAPGLTSIHTDLSLSPGTLTLGGALHVYGAVSIPAARTLDDSGNFTITIDGNWSNTGGTFTSGTGTVVFAGAVNQTVNPGTSSFNNLTKQGGSRLSLLANDLIVTGTLSVALAADTVDMTNRSFTIGILDNNGTLELDGTQTTQVITTMDIDTGRVLYNGAGGGTIFLPTFFSLEISSATQTFALDLPITINGNLILTAGTLDVSASNHQITLSGDWVNANSVSAFNSRYGTVVFNKPAGTIYIWGDNNWYFFSCTVPGITIAFEQDKIQAMVDVAGATFRINGQPLNWITLTGFTPPGPPYTPPTLRWRFTLYPAAVLDMAYVNVDWSWATPYNITTPVDVLPTVNCIGWLITILVTADKTEDWDADGKIDRIRVKCQANINDNFTNFVARVQDYTLASPAYDGAHAALAADEFWIMLQEKPYLDTDVAPRWWIDQNTTLRDSATGIYIVIQSNPALGQVPMDAAPPIIGYTLAVADKNEIFVHFSEPVEKAGGGIIDATDFTYSGAGVITGFSRKTTSGNFTKEALLTLDANVTATEGLSATITVPALRDAGTIPIWPIPPAWLLPPYSIPPNPIPVALRTHRVTDVGLGLVGDGVIEPVWAHDQTTAPQTTTGIGRINLFDGTKWLRDQDITLTGHVHNNIVLDPGTKLWFDVGVDASLKSSSGLWLPPFNSSTYSGVVPFQNPSARPSTGTAIGTQVREYLIPGSDLEIVDGARLEFLFQVLANGTTILNDLYCARLTDPAASDWYRRVVPWAFDVHEIKTQKGNVSILNNVINPSLGQTVTLQYVQPTIGSVTISVFDLAGNLVKVLARASGQAAGDYAVTWDGKNTGGRSVARGIYFIRIVAPGIDEMRKVLVVR
jgi:fibronectin-binding autotransporter adhesin